MKISLSLYNFILMAAHFGIAPLLFLPNWQPNVSGQSQLPSFAVVELFTSEGCSSCPPAEKYLNDLAAKARAQNQKIYPLAFHVDYWNYLGWKDAFSDGRFSARQRGYADRASTGRVYTPQMIVNGEVAFVGSNRQQGEAALTQALRQPAEVELHVQARHEHEQKKIMITYRIPAARPQSVLCVALVERGIRREIRSGENSGRVLHHDNVVRAFETVALQSPASGQIALPLPSGFALTNSAIITFVQDLKTNRIVGATSVDL